MKACDVDDFETLLSDATDQASSDWEMDFVSDIQEKFDAYGGDMYVSEKQVAALEKIAGY
jgi:hypothetical protein